MYTRTVNACIVGAFVSVAAEYGFVDTSTCCLIATIDGAGVGVFANHNRSDAFSRLTIAIFVGTIEAIVAALGIKDAFPSFCIACVGRTRVTVTALDGWILASTGL